MNRIKNVIEGLAAGNEEGHAAGAEDEHAH